MICAPPLPESESGRSGGPRFFGRRRGRPIRRTGVTLLESLLPRLAIAAPPEGTVLDPFLLFPDPVREVWLEIGFGGGEHLARQATDHPDIGFIGSEVFLNGVASLLGHVHREGIENLRVFPEDVRRLFPALPDGCLGRVFLLFPDPWPKKRHAERRFVGPENLDMLARLMMDGAELRIATDDETYKAWAIAQMAVRTEFRDLGGDHAQRPADWPPTRYEEKARREGRKPEFFIYQRTPRKQA